MENILILDTETTGLDPSKGKVLEIATILFNIPSRSIIQQVSVLMYAESNPAFEVNRISVDALKSVKTITQEMGILHIFNLMKEADAIVAHNAEFDRKWVGTIEELRMLSNDKRWICTKNDVIWPIRKNIPLNLVHICVDLGVPIVNAHRALSDCDLLVSALSKIEDIAYFLDQSGYGRVMVYANLSYDQRQLAKDAGFKWDNDKKCWFNRIAPADIDRLPFGVYQIINGVTHGQVQGS